MQNASINFLKEKLEERIKTTKEDYLPQRDDFRWGRSGVSSIPLS